MKKKGISDARKQLFESGVSRMLFPGSLRGLQLPFGVYSLAMESIGSADAPTAMSVGIHNTVADGIYQFGSDEQRRQFLMDLIEGKKLALPLP